MLSVNMLKIITSVTNSLQLLQLLIPQSLLLPTIWQNGQLWLYANPNEESAQRQQKSLSEIVD